MTNKIKIIIMNYFPHCFPLAHLHLDMPFIFRKQKCRHNSGFPQSQNFSLVQNFSSLFLNAKLCCKENIHLVWNPFIFHTKRLFTKAKVQTSAFGRFQSIRCPLINPRLYSYSFSLHDKLTFFFLLKAPVFYCC